MNKKTKIKNNNTIIKKQLLQAKKMKVEVSLNQNNNNNKYTLLIKFFE